MTALTLYQDLMLELYRLPGCPYCAKVENKLNELDLESRRIPYSPFDSSDSR
jgi:hypothetical protein